MNAPKSILGRTRSKISILQRVTCSGRDKRIACSMLVGKTNGKGHLGNRHLDGRIVVKRILEKSVVKMSTGVNWLRIMPNKGISSIIVAVVVVVVVVMQMMSSI
jgi:hypothetical protein